MRCGTDFITGDFFQDYCRFQDKVDYWESERRKRLGRLIVNIPGYSNPLISHSGCFHHYINLGNRSSCYGEGKRKLLNMDKNLAIKKLIGKDVAYASHQINYFSVDELRIYFGLIEPEDFIVCRVCGRKLKILKPSHFQSIRCCNYQARIGIRLLNSEEYIKKYPSAYVKSLKYSRMQSKAMKGRKMPDDYSIKLSRGHRKFWYSLSPEERSNRIWSKGLTKETDKRLAEHAEKVKKFFKSLTEEEKGRRLYKTVFKGRHHPNPSELKLFTILSDFGFTYNGAGPKLIGGHMPDFIHNKLNLVIEYDGDGGHNPKVPWVHKNQLELDNKRDIKYRTRGYDVLRIFPHDLKMGQEHVKNLVKKALTNLHDWEQQNKELVS